MGGPVCPSDAAGACWADARAPVDLVGHSAVRTAGPVACTIAGAFLLLAAACSSDGSSGPTRAELTGRLRGLRASASFSTSQVGCVADRALATLRGADLQAFYDQLLDYQRDGSTADMTPRSLKVFTDAIAACAVPTD